MNVVQKYTWELITFLRFEPATVYHEGAPITILLELNLSTKQPRNGD